MDDNATELTWVELGSLVFLLPSTPIFFFPTLIDWNFQCFNFSNRRQIEFIVAVDLKSKLFFDPTSNVVYIL